MNVPLLNIPCRFVHCQEIKTGIQILEANNILALNQFSSNICPFNNATAGYVWGLITVRINRLYVRLSWFVFAISGKMWIIEEVNKLTGIMEMLWRRKFYSKVRRNIFFRFLSMIMGMIRVKKKIGWAELLKARYVFIKKRYKNV